MSIVTSVLLIVGVITALIGTMGCFRFDNFLARTHAVSIVDTFSTLLIILGLVLHYGLSLLSLKLLLILVFLYITGSTAIHALTQVFLKHSGNKGEIK